MTHDELIAFAKNRFNTCAQVMSSKNHDYSYGEDALTNFKSVEQFGVKVEDGFITRLTDKMKRISNLLKVEAAVKDEKIEDTILDGVNYLILLAAYLHDKKNQKPKSTK